MVISLYLFVVFSLLIMYKSMILAQHHISFARHGFALLNALALAKVMLVARELNLGDQFNDAPLIYPTLIKSFAFTVVLAGSAVAEEVAIGGLHGKSFHQSFEVGGGSLTGNLTVSFLVFVMLIPFFGFMELRRVFGRCDRRGLFPTAAAAEAAYLRGVGCCMLLGLRPAVFRPAGSSLAQPSFRL